jgi:adenine/guanine phosphoribosyltransferase-like PRPP-binding protein
VLTIDLHAGQIQGFFDIPTDNLFAEPVISKDIMDHYTANGPLAVVSPDVGGVVRARAIAKRVDAPLAIVDKRRDRPGESEVMNVIGEVEGMSCLLVDDIIDSGGTLCNAADALLGMGAKEVSAYITHGVLSGGAVTRIAGSNLKELVITDTIETTEAVKKRPQHPCRHGGKPAWRGHHAHRLGKIGLQPVCLDVPKADDRRASNNSYRQKPGAPGRRRDRMNEDELLDALVEGHAVGQKHSPVCGFAAITSVSM